jgi:hypothetical protein
MDAAIKSVKVIGKEYEIGMGNDIGEMDVEEI